METPNMIKSVERMLLTLEVMGLFLVLFMAFAFQLVLHELPCPLCLLQRVGMLGMAFGFLLNLRFGLRPSHYAITLLSAIYTAFVAMRQIALHIVPGTGVYGDAIFGLHLYTWSFIISILIIITTTFMLGIDRQYQIPDKANIKLPVLTHFLFGVMLLLVITNGISVFMECGIQQCPDNPTHYLW